MYKPVACERFLLSVYMASIINKAIGGLKHVFTSGPDSVLGIDISASSIKVVELSRSGGQAVLETYGELSLGPYVDREVGQAVNLSKDQITGALKDVLREAKVSAKTCGVAIPLSSSLISIVELPPIDEKKLKDVIPLEARKYIPVPISEVLLDWHIIPQEEDEHSDDDRPQEALIVAIHKETVNRYRDIIAESGLDTAFFEIELFSTIRSVLDRGIKPVLVLDLGVGSSKMYIVEHGVVRGSHSVNRGSQDITRSFSQALDIDFRQAEKIKREHGLLGTYRGESLENTGTAVLNHVFTEAKRVMLNYEKKYNNPVRKVVLSGGGSLLRGIDGVAKKHMEIEVAVADPFAKIKTPAFLQGVLTEAGPEFAVAIGIALRHLEG